MEWILFTFYREFPFLNTSDAGWGESPRLHGGDSNPAPREGGSLTARGKEFKSAPELETKGAFMRGGVELQSQRWLPFGDRERES